LAWNGAKGTVCEAHVGSARLCVRTRKPDYISTIVNACAVGEARSVWQEKEKGTATAGEFERFIVAVWECLEKACDVAVIIYSIRVVEQMLAVRIECLSWDYGANSVDRQSKDYVRDCGEKDPATVDKKIGSIRIDEHSKVGVAVRTNDLSPVVYGERFRKRDSRAGYSEAVQVPSAEQRAL
jgi:hypothetical protein